MPITFALIGLIIGGLITGFSGALFGALLGFTIGHLIVLREQVLSLARSVQELKDRVADKRTGDESTATSTAREPVRVMAASQPIPQSKSVSHDVPEPVRETLRERAAEPPLRPTVALTAIPQADSDASFAPSKWLREFFTGGNTVVRISIAILFVGVGLLLQYASERGALSIEVRLLGVAVGALVLLALGWRLRRKRFGYAIALQGGAVGVLYLTIFAALRAYNLLPARFAFALLLVIVLLAAALAILQNAMWLALLGVSGGFLAPILTSSGAGNHVALFSFYAVLNVGIVSIAWFKAWRPLNLVGFAFTFAIGAFWGMERYRPELLASTEPFLIAFFLMYVAVAVLFAARQAPELKGYVDGTIVFGTPITAFAMQSALLFGHRNALAISALAVSALYVTLAWGLWRRRASWRLLAESFLALSVAFATLAIPLALNGRWSAATWALEGAALLWVGCRQRQRLPRAAGMALQFAAAFMFLRDLDVLFAGLPILNSTCLGAVLIAGAAIFSSRTLLVHAEDLRPVERDFVGVFFLWGVVWWSIAGIGEIDRWLAPHYDARAWLAFAALSAVACSELERRWQIAIARLAALSLLIVLAAAVAFDWSQNMRPSSAFGWLVWPTAAGVWYALLYRHEGSVSTSAQRLLHVSSVVVMSVLLSRELEAWIDFAVAGAGSWSAIAWAAIPALYLFFISRSAHRAWPFAQHIESYLLYAGAILALYLAAWSLITSVARYGNPYPLPYVPLMNPLDLAQAFVLVAGVRWLRARHAMRERVDYRAAAIVVGAVTFVWLNAVLLRTIHYWGDVAYEPRVLWRSTLVQTSLSIFWTCLALATMLLAAHRGIRWLWYVGAVLMTVVVAKLFFVDLSSVGSIARIVSFIGVGLLMLIIGYFSPLPPQMSAQVSSQRSSQTPESAS